MVDNRTLMQNIMEQTQTNFHIMDSYLKANSILSRYRNPVVSISGGSDSDIMLDIFTRLDTEKKCRYVWFDTGIEYRATKDHLKYLEQRYGIIIERERAIKPIPVSCQECGQPFWSKFVSEMIERLQKHGFQWEDDSFENLTMKYPGCRAALKWWTNHCDKPTDQGSRFHISNVRGLKEFMLKNPPSFLISNKCCTFAKKEVSARYVKKSGCDLMIVGIRKSEGGIRSTIYKNCFTNNDIDDSHVSQYRPLFWYDTDDKKVYDQIFNIKHSDCYEVYGFSRTGCVGCPYGQNLKDELFAMEKFEPGLFKLATCIFKDTYDYTMRFKEFRNQNN